MGWGGSLPLHQFASAALLHKMYLPTIYNIYHISIKFIKFIIYIYQLDTFKSCQRISGFTSPINKPGMMSSIGKAPHLVSADCAMLVVGTSYQQESSPLIHPVLQPRRQRRDAARENGEDVRPRAGVGRQDRTLPQAAGAGMQSQACHNNRVGIELSTDLCEVSQ